MPDYVRPKVPGASVFFTVALADRGSDVLVREIGRLREAVRESRAERPFTIDAWVVLPDHMHGVWTLPDGDAYFSTRWAAIKARFSKAMRRAGFIPPPPVGRVNGGVNPALRLAGEGARIEVDQAGRVRVVPTHRRGRAAQMMRASTHPTLATPKNLAQVFRQLDS